MLTRPDSCIYWGSELVIDSGAYYAKSSAMDKPPPHGGNLNFHDLRGHFEDPTNFIPAVQTELQAQLGRVSGGQTGGQAR